MSAIVVKEYTYFISNISCTDEFYISSTRRNLITDQGKCEMDFSFSIILFSIVITNKKTF